MKIYDIEQKDGLSDLLSNKSIKYCSAAVLGEAHALPIEQLLHLQAKAQNDGQMDLHYINTLLVSVGWNLNDDVFDKNEVWAAKDTPSDKMFNMGHCEEDIIGHMTSSKILVGELPDVKEYDGTEVPDSYHISSAVVLYKYWESETLQNRLDKVIAEIPEGKWFVSMEAWFENFDFSVISPDGQQSVIARAESSCYLTKHLRAYGGDGKYKEYRVGRLLRNLTFKGSALVMRPANPNSIIFTTAKNNNIKQFSGVKSNIENIFQKEKEIMTTENKEPLVELTKANEEIKRLTKEVAESGVKQLKDEVVTLTKSVADAKEQAADLEKQLTDAKTEGEAKAKKLVEAEKSITDLTAELAKVKSEVKTAARMNSLIAVGLSEDEAKKKVEALASADDSVFALVVSMIPKTEAKVEETETEDEDIDADSTEATVTEVDDDEDATLGVDETDAQAQKEADFNKSVAAFLLNEQDE